MNLDKNRFSTFERPDCLGWAKGEWSRITQGVRGYTKLCVGRVRVCPSTFVALNRPDLTQWYGEDGLWAKSTPIKGGKHLRKFSRNFAQISSRKIREIGAKKNGKSKLIFVRYIFFRFLSLEGKFHAFLVVSSLKNFLRNSCLYIITTTSRFFSKN
jgi:hypothetical protein